MTNYLINQNYDNYTTEDHQTWKMLCDRQSQLPADKVSKEYLNGFYQLKIDKVNIIKIEEVSKRLESISGKRFFLYDHQ
jgi:phenylalanine-4-hydroxylase